MTLKDLVREAPMGQLIRFVTKNYFLQYPEEKPDFKLPDCWVDLMNNPERDLPVFSDTIQGGSSGSPSTADGGEHKPRLSREQSDANNEKQESPGDNSSPPESDKDDDRSEQHLHLQRTATSVSARNSTEARLEEEQIHSLEQTKSIPIMPRRTRDGAILVDWYYSDDPANPHN